MNIELSRDAVQLKLKSRWDAPLISALEYSYAAGLGLKKMGTDSETARELRDMEDFTEFREKVKELVRASDVWTTFEHGEKLQQMLLECRVKDKLDEHTRTLFDMGYQG